LIVLYIHRYLAQVAVCLDKKIFKKNKIVLDIPNLADRILFAQIGY